MPFCGCKITLLAGEKSDTTSAVIISDKPRMYSCLTYERVTTVHSVWNCGILLCCCWTANHIRLVIDLLVAHRMWIQHPHSLTIGRTSKGEGSIVKRTTSVSVQTTAVAGVPTTFSIDHPRACRAAHQKLAPHQIGWGFP